MTAFHRFRAWLAAPRLRRQRRRPFSAVPAAEALEDRVLLTNSIGQHDIEIVGRDSTGAWTAGGYDAGGTLQNTAFAQWSNAINWQNVRSGDFDGDGSADLIGRDPSSGNWYVSLSDMVGATTRLAMNWSTGTTWSDVSVVDFATTGDRGTQGHFTNKSDLVGRSGDGTWWISASNGDGTFTTVPVATWSPDAGWHDVRFFDANGDGIADIIARASDGAWYGALSGNGTFTTTFLAKWSEAANWQDVRVLSGGLVAWSAVDGSWWGLRMPGNGTATTIYAGRWSAGAGWHDVMTSDLDGDGTQETLARTSTGDWYAGTALTSTMVWKYLGTWTEGAGWKDVQIAHTEVAGDIIVGRSSDGYWWASDVLPNAKVLTTATLGRWSPDGGWKDVKVARVSREPIHVDRQFNGTSLESITVYVQAQRSGTTVVAENTSDGSRVGLKITYRSAAGVSTTATVFATGTTASVAWAIDFEGHIGNDTFVNRSGAPSTARGWSGDDSLDGRDNGVKDILRGGDGNDVALGNGPDDANVN